MMLHFRELGVLMIPFGGALGLSSPRPWPVSLDGGEMALTMPGDSLGPGSWGPGAGIW